MCDQVAFDALVGSSNIRLTLLVSVLLLRPLVMYLVLQLMPQQQVIVFGMQPNHASVPTYR